MLKHTYSNEIKNKKILIIGPYPPPLGGVSIHIKRVVKKFEQQKNIVHTYNTAKKYTSKAASLKCLTKTLWKTKPDIVYYHEPTESIQKLAVVVGLKKFLQFKLVTVDHDCRLLYTFSKSKKMFFRSIMKKVDLAVIIGDSTARCYAENTLNLKRLKKHYIESPFIPPSSPVRNLSTKINHFFSTKTPVITANAFAPVADNDLYGFGLCIKLIKTLKKTYPNIGLVFGICKVETESHKLFFEKVKTEIKELSLEDNFLFLINQPDFWQIIKKSDVFVRPTRSDSFGISVQEAVFFGIPAVASDVCVRPKETVLFESGNTGDFIGKTSKALTQKSLHPGEKPKASTLRPDSAKTSRIQPPSGSLDFSAQRNRAAGGHITKSK